MLACGCPTLRPMRWLMGGQVYDVADGSFRAADIGVENGRIATIGSGAHRAADDGVIDASGLWLLPGLIDCHVHLTLPTDAGDPAASANRTDAAITLYAAGAAARTLLAGITTVRDVGGWNYVEMAVRDAVVAGSIPGPRMFLAGRLLSITTSTVEYYPGMYELADGADAVRAAARRQLAKGADLIKVMATGAMLSSETEDSRAIQFTLEELRAAVEIAHDNHKHVAAHCHALRGIENAVEAGVDSIEHCTFADDAVLRKMAAAGTSLVPTLCAGELLFRDPAAVASMPPHLLTRMAEFNELHLAAIRRAHELGVTIAMGTDAGTPGNHHGLNAEECVVLAQQAGMSPQDSIRSATVNAARLLRQADHLGALDERKHADIIGVRENPLDDITALTRVAVVMKAGDIARNDLSD
jgi:imidazolonepropionase-like amidohydrolase